MIWTRAERKRQFKKLGFTKEQCEAEADRRSGRSTLIAFETFAQCYKNRNEWIQIVDHYKGGGDADWFLYQSMTSMASSLRFNFEWKKTGRRYFIRLKD